MVLMMMMMTGVGEWSDCECYDVGEAFGKHADGVMGD